MLASWGFFKTNKSGSSVWNASPDKPVSPTCSASSVCSVQQLEGDFTQEPTPVEALSSEERVAKVTGYDLGADGVVYYEVTVENLQRGPLSAYTVRRRYSEFCKLRENLAHELRMSRRSISMPSLPTSFSSSSLSTSTSLPTLPDAGGLWSYLYSYEPKLLQNRLDCFEKLLKFAQSNVTTSSSMHLKQFLGQPPDSRQRRNTYVSLSMYAAPSMNLSVEREERRRQARARSRSSPKRLLHCQSEL